MNKVLTILLAGILMLSCGGAWAEEDDDLLGLYFEPMYRMRCAEGTYPFTARTMYLTYYNPTVSYVTGFECGITWGPGDGVVYTSGSTWCGLTLEAYQLNNLHIACPLLPCSQATVLMTLEWFYIEPDGEMVLFFIGEAAAPSQPGGPFVRLQDGTQMAVAVDELWMGGGAAAGITSWFDVCSPLATEEHSWDAVKSLYR